MISIDISRGTAFFSGEVWEMIRRNNGLLAEFLTWIHDNYGDRALKLNKRNTAKMRKKAYRE